MSTLKTDTIVGTGENNEVTFINNKMTGTASGSITLPAEGGTVTTNLQQGLTKYWISFEGRSTVSNEKFTKIYKNKRDDCFLCFSLFSRSFYYFMLFHKF